MKTQNYFLTILFLVSSQAAFARGVFSGPFPEDNFQTIVETASAVTNISVMHSSNLGSGMAQQEPWAGSYWPIHKGLLGNRYADSGFPKSKSFSVNYAYYQSYGPSYMLAMGQVNQLSPSEKYDLLIGDSSWTLTRVNWQKGFDDLMQNGSVPTWTGICHGWSGATHMAITPPARAVDARDVSGRYSIRFYPHDIKALLSYMWAQSPPATKRAGNRCRQERPVLDDIGRPIDPSCLDSNPMTWHVTVVNRVGIQKKSFVMDSSSGPEVWNFPLIGYDYHYFNPSTMETSHQLSPSVVKREDFRLDRYARTRDPRARFIVGIIMEAYHPSLIEPTTGVPKENRWNKKQFLYDLELDENMNIVGGEWYGKDRPDFLWAYPDKSRAGTREDSELGNVNWNPGSPLPSNVAGAAASASSRRQVLANIVNALWNASEVPLAEDENPESENPTETLVLTP